MLVLCLSFKQVMLMDEVPEIISQDNVQNIGDCVLCAACNFAPDITNKSGSICTLQKHVQYLSSNSLDLNINKECYKLGDFSELISRSSEGSQCSYFSILPQADNKAYCKFNVSYFDVNMGSFVLHDILFAKFGQAGSSKAKTISLNGQWKVIHKVDDYGNKKFKFDVLSIKGTIHIDKNHLFEVVHMINKFVE